MFPSIHLTNALCSWVALPALVHELGRLRDGGAGHAHGRAGDVIVLLNPGTLARLDDWIAWVDSDY